MRFCQSHWGLLKAAIDERGLSPLIAKGGEQAVRNLAAEARDGRSIQKDWLSDARFIVGVYEHPRGVAGQRPQECSTCHETTSDYRVTVDDRVECRPCQETA